jgi:hypothetical protein
MNKCDTWLDVNRQYCDAKATYHTLVNSMTEEDRADASKRNDLIRAMARVKEWMAIINIAHQTYYNY